MVAFLLCSHMVLSLCMYRERERETERQRDSMHSGVFFLFFFPFLCSFIYIIFKSSIQWFLYSYIVHYLKYFLLFYYSCTNFSPFALFCPAQPLPHTPTVSPHTCPCPWVTCTCSLVLSPSFHHYPPFPTPLVTVSLLHVSTSVVLFCPLVYFVH